jgi:hypothetical protein
MTTSSVRTAPYDRSAQDRLAIPDSEEHVMQHHTLGTQGLDVSALGMSGLT